MTMQEMEKAYAAMAASAEELLDLLPAGECRRLNAEALRGFRHNWERAQGPVRPNEFGGPFWGASTLRGLGCFVEKLAEIVTRDVLEGPNGGAEAWLR